ncbi:MAG: T9SS type A sorting domain-containing protein [Bacteroidetes bacterium]|nr:T9SS type A sorting domain-containing protein [Bacteroidota bacterium]
MKFSTLLFVIAATVFAVSAPAFAQTGFGIRIGNSASSGGSWDDSGNPAVWTATNLFVFPYHTINKDEIISRLNAGISVTLVTTGSGEIIDSAGIVISKTSGGDATLKFQANTNISFSQNDTIVSTSGKLNIILNADADSSLVDGYISIPTGYNATNYGSLYASSNGGDIVIGGGSDPYTTTLVGPTNVNVANLHGTKLIAGAGNITINVQDQYSSIGLGLYKNYNNETSLLQTTSGNITINATGGGGSGYAIGMSENSVIQTDDGAITITATGTTTSGIGGYGIAMDNGAAIQATNNGSITINATGGNGASGGVSGGYGLYLYRSTGTNPVIQTVNGNITITATAGTTTTGGNTANDGIKMKDVNITSTGTGSITITATGGGGAANGGSGIYSEQSLIQTNSGSITINTSNGAGTSSSGSGLFLNSSSGSPYGLISTSGAITVNSSVTNGGTQFFIQGSGMKIQTGGNISLNGTRSGSGNGKGLQFAFASKIYATGTGNILITTSGGSTGSNNYGILFPSTGNSVVQTENGNITINATGGGDGSGYSNDGLMMYSGCKLYSSGFGRVEVNVQGGNNGSGLNTESNSGNVFIQSDSGKVIVNAIAGGTNITGMSKGYFTNSLYIVAKDSVSVTGVATGTGIGVYSVSNLVIGSGNGITHTGATVISAGTGTGSDAIQLSGTISGTGTLQLQPYAASTDIGIAGGNGAFNLSTSDLASLQNGFRMITIGRSDGTGGIVTGPNGGTVTFDDSLTLLSNTGAIFYMGNISVGVNGLTVMTGGSFNPNTANQTLTAGTLTISGPSWSTFRGSFDVVNLTSMEGSINSNVQVNNELHLNAAHLTLNSYSLTLGTSATNPGVLTNSGGRVYTTFGGTFKRWIADTTTELLFPLANDTYQEKSLNLSYSSSPITGGTLSAMWVWGNAGTNGLPLSEGGWAIPLVESSGYWSITAGDGISGGTYNLDVANEGVSYTDSTKVHILQRANSGSNWSLQGTHLNATTSNSLSYGHRTGVTTYGEFGWGKAVGSATTLALVSGNNQIGSLNTTLSNPFTIKVTDSNGDGVPGVAITYAIVDSPYSSNGHLLSTYSTTTNGTGNASSILTWGNTSGRYSVTATASGLSGSPQTFTAMVFDQTPGSALTFDGTDDVISVPASSSINLSVGTWEAWVKLNSTAHHNRILLKEGADNNGKYELYALDNGLFNADVVVAGNRYTASATGITATTGSWYHLAATFDGSNLKIYVNGTLRGTTAIVGSIDDNTGSLGIGGGVNPTDFRLEGSLDEVRIWNIALTDSAIQADMHKSFSSLPSGLVAWWQCKEGSGSSKAIDVVNGNIGTLTNMNTTSSWTTSTIPFGAGTTSTLNSFSSGTASLGDLSITTTDAFDNSLSLASRSYTVAPDTVPSGTVLNNTYWSVDGYGDPGTFISSVTFTVPSSFTNSNTKFLSQYKLYGRPFGGAGNWTLLNTNASSSTSTTITFNGVTQLGQFELATTSVTSDSTPGYALKFDGTDDYVNAGSGVNIANSSFTVDFWAKRSSNTGGYIMSQGAAVDNQGLHIGWNTASQLRFDFYGLEGLNVSVAYDSLWHHWAFTYDAATNARKILMDGVIIASDAPSNDYSGSGTIYLGRRFDSGFPQFAGSLDEVRIWNSALDSTTIRENMHRVFPTNTSGLLAEWQFAEGSGTTVGDPITGNAGTLTNFNFTASSGWANSTIIAGYGTSASASAFATGTANFNVASLSLTTTNNFDTPVELTATAITVSPNVQPTGAASTLSDRYWVLDKFNDSVADTFSANLTFTVPSSFTSGVPNSFYKLYSREGNGDGSWTLVKTGASTSTSTSVSFNGITSFSQFAIGKSDSYPFDTTAGYALSFDGTDDFVALPATFTPGAYTIEMWIKPATTNNMNIFVRTDGLGNQNFAYSHQLKIEGGKFVHYLYDEYNYGPLTLNGTTNIVANQWYHIAIVAGDYYNSGTQAMQLYVNGVKEADILDTYPNDYPSQLWTGGTVYLLGSDGGGLANFQGKIDEVKIWNFVRSAVQIREDMHRTQYGAPSGLVAYYQLNTGNGTTATDIYNDYNGTLYNSPTWVPSTAPVGKGTTTSSTLFSTGTTSLGTLSLTTTDAFDAAIDLYSTAISVAPNSLPSGSSTTLNDRYWIVNTFGTPGTFSANLTFTVPSTFTNGGTASASNYTLYRRNSNDDSSWTSIASGASITDTSVTFSGISSFSQFAIGTNDPLPVELVSFTVTAKNNAVEVQWKTATEQNNYGFDVERRAVDDRHLQGDGHLAWKKIGFIEGNGSTNSPKQYSFTNKNLSAGKYSYRLKQIDRDGKFSYSQSVEVTINSVPKVFALEQNYPNPFNPSTTINYQLPVNSHVTLKVYDAIGREVATLVNEVKEAGTYSTTFDASELSSGMYLLRLQGQDHVKVKKIMLMK